MPTASTNSMTLADHPAPPGDARHSLKVYLRDHRGGAAFGQSLARRSQEANAGTELGDTLAVVAREIEEDRRSLDSIMARLGIKPSLVKLALAKGADVAARPKLHGRLQPNTSVSRVLQLEALTASIFVAALVACEQHAGVVVLGVGEPRAGAHAGVHRDRVVVVSARRRSR